MADITNEMREKLLSAKSVEDIAALLKEADIDETQAERLWAELEQKREADGGKLSLDELEAVSGGKRNWVTDGCAATVEPGSLCWSNDVCFTVEEHYDNGPVHKKCPTCGIYLYSVVREEGDKHPIYYVCKKCNFTKFSSHYDTTDKAR